MKKKIIDYFLKNKRKIIIFSSLFVALLILLDLSIFGSWWRIWPRPIRSRIAINRLAVSVYNNPYCHNICYFEQLNYEKEILKSLDNRRIFKKMSDIVVSESDGLSWRLRVIDILSKNKDHEFMPTFIERAQAYIDSDLANDAIRESLILSFKEHLDPSVYLERVRHRGLSETSRSSFFRIVSSLNSDLSFDEFINLDDVRIDKDLIIFVNDNYEHFYDQIESYFAFLREQFFENIDSRDMGETIIFTLSSYLDSSEKDLAVNSLDLIYKDERIDIFSKHIIAEILGYDDNLPEISRSEWNYYYNRD